MQFLNLQELLSFIAILVDHFFFWTSLLCFAYGTSPWVSLVDLQWDQIACYMILSLSLISSFYFFCILYSCNFPSFLLLWIHFKDSHCLLQMLRYAWLLDFQAQCWDVFLFLLFQVIEFLKVFLSVSLCKLHSIFVWPILTSQVYLIWGDFSSCD